MADLSQYQQFSIPGLVQVVPGTGDLPMIRITNSFAECDLFLHGAHVARFQPKGQQDVLWMSPLSAYQVGKPLRGGIPLCFPWFGAHKTNPSLPMHGFARIRTWTLASTAQLSDGRTEIVLVLTDAPETLAMWPFRFRLELKVVVGPSLEVTLLIENRGNEPFTCDEALHTYFNVADASHCSVSGLNGVMYRDRLRFDARAVQVGDVKFQGEMVNAYMDVPSTIDLVDELSNRTFHLEQQGLDAAVVWNPWETTAAANPELKGLWRQFVCVESANCLDRHLLVLPGASHRSFLSCQARN
jgi:D-hexose-6-phosphate mutarotase